MTTDKPRSKTYLKEYLELPRAVLLQLRDTHLFNDLLDDAIKDIDELLAVASPNKPDDVPEGEVRR